MRAAIGRLACLGLLVAAVAGCEEAVPATPTFAIDVWPIFQAHCVRCHGAGDALSGDPRALEPIPPGDGYLDHYEDQGDCVLDANARYPPSCRHGALYEVGNGNLKLYLRADFILRMPLKPSEPLAKWEMAVIDNWLAESPPAP